MALSLGQTLALTLGSRPAPAAAGPPGANVMSYFRSDDIARFGSPNYGYGGFTNQGTLAGSWDAPVSSGSSYYNRRRRVPRTYTAGAVTQWGAYGTGTAGINLISSAPKADYRFLHDGTTAYTLYVWLTRDSNTNAQRIFSSTTSPTGVGACLQGRNSFGQLTFTTGNASAATCINHNSGSTSSFSPNAPHSYTLFVNAYTSIGAQACQSRVDGASLVSTNWAATPSTGGDSTHTLALFDTLNGSGYAWALFNRAITPGSAEDIDIQAWGDEIARVGLTPDAFSVATRPRLVFQGDSLTACNVSPPVWAEYITLNQAFDLTMLALGGREMGPVGGTDTMTKASNVTLVDNVYTASARCIAVIWGGTNDFFGSRSAASVESELRGWITGRKAVGFKTLACTTMDRTGFDSTKRAQRDLYNTAIRGDNAGADGIFDPAALFGNGWWTAIPDDGTPPTDATHPGWGAAGAPYGGGQAKIVAAITPALNALLV